MSARARAIAAESREIDESQSRAIAAREERQAPRNALEAMAQRLQISPAGLQSTLKATVFRDCKKDEEFFALVVVANTYGLNPLLKEIYAFPAKGGGIVPMVSIDGWIRIMNEHPQFDGIEFDYINNEKGQIEAIEAVVYRKDRGHPVKVIEYLDENVRGTEPWKQMKRRMLRHRALIQGVRIAFGFSGIAGEGDEIELTAQSTPSLPSSKSLGEEIGDKIPTFDGETGEQVDPETGEIKTDERGMTELSEEEARALDAGADNQAEATDETEQDADDEAGETDGDEESPIAAKLREIRGGINAAKNLKYLASVDKTWVKARGAYDDATADEIDGLIAAKRRELQGGEGGK